MPATVRNTEGPIIDLLYAVNFYISIGDHIGEENAAATDDGQLPVAIPLSKTNRNDQADADRLEQRVTEIQSGGAVAVTLERHKDTGAFDYMLLKLDVEGARPLVREMVGQMSGKHPSMTLTSTCRVFGRKYSVANFPKANAPEQAKPATSKGTIKAQKLASPGRLP